MDLKLLGLTEEIINLLTNGRMIDIGRCNGVESCATETNINIKEQIMNKEMLILPKNVNIDAIETNIKITNDEQ